MALQNAKSARKVTKGKAKSQALVAQPWIDGCTVQKFAGCAVPSRFRHLFGLLSLLACIGSITGAGTL
jgi:hypothetical protein